jgi:small GTP-binding protein
MAASKQKKESCKLLILGDTQVGKTTLLKRLETGKFMENVKQTDFTGIPDYIERDFEVYDKTVNLQVWDTAGHERFNSVTTQYFRSVQGYILGYDITNAKTFDQGLMDWRKLLVEHSGADPKILLLGLKLDLSSERDVPKEKAEDYTRTTDVSLFYETSAKSGDNVEKAFEEFLRIIFAPETGDSQPQERERIPTVRVGQGGNKPEGSKCPC